MKFRVSLAGSSNITGKTGGLNTGFINNVAMSFTGGSTSLGGLGKGRGIILSSDEILEVSYNTMAITAETMSETQSEISLRIVGRLLPSTTENEAGSGGTGGIVGGIMGALGMGSLFKQYQSMKNMFKKDDEETFSEGENLNNIKGNNLLSSSGVEEKVSDKKSKTHLISQVLGVSSTLPIVSSFANGIGKSLTGMFGGLDVFGVSDLYDRNKQNIIDISEWAMLYGDGNSTKDVLVQADLGSGKSMEMYFPKMYVYSFNQDFSVGSGEGYFVLDLKQTAFNESDVDLK